MHRQIEFHWPEKVLKEIKILVIEVLARMYWNGKINSVKWGICLLRYSDPPMSCYRFLEMVATGVN